MLSKLRFVAGKITGSLWFRPAAYALVALLALAATPVVEPFVPWQWKELVSSETNETVLSILASSLLAVAIFSLSAMVAALRAASNSATPRARPLLVGDAAAQNAISTFIGAFLFSLLGVIGTLLGVFSPTGRVLLFVATLVLVFIVVATFIRWLQRLSNMGDVMEAIRRVEQAADAAFRTGAPLRRADAPDPPLYKDGAAIYAERPGFVQAIALESLEGRCDALGRRARVTARIGDFVDAHAPLLRLDAPVADEDEEALRGALTIGDERRFDEDPRLGLIVLSEIASKALSPGINDPGTAIGAIRAAQRVLDRWRRRAEPREALGGDTRVHLPPLSPEEVFECAFGPIVFDGWDRPEVASTLLSVYAGLRDALPRLYGPAAEAMAADLIERCGVMDHEADRRRINAKAARLGFAPEGGGRA
ncbi:MAG: DUF2254 domain-containing protein [Oceanicaulis sp.]